MSPVLCTHNGCDRVAQLMERDQPWCVPHWREQTALIRPSV